MDSSISVLPTDIATHRESPVTSSSIWYFVRPNRNARALFFICALNMFSIYFRIRLGRMQTAREHMVGNKIPLSRQSHQRLRSPYGTGIVAEPLKNFFDVRSPFAWLHVFTFAAKRTKANCRSYSSHLVPRFHGLHCALFLFCGERQMHLSTPLSPQGESRSLRDTLSAIEKWQYTINIVSQKHG